MLITLFILRYEFLSSIAVYIIVFLKVDDASNRASSAIKIWIARLEAEVNRFNAENAALSKLKAKREEV